MIRSPTGAGSSMACPAATGAAARAVAGTPIINGQFDGCDGNTPACGSNTWQGNDFATVNQPCVGG